MKTAKTLPIIGLTIGAFLILTSFTLLFISKDSVFNNSQDSISEDTYEPANILNLEDQDSQDMQPEEDDEEGLVKKEEEVPEEKLKLRESGWIPNWAFDLGYESLKNNK